MKKEEKWKKRTGNGGGNKEAGVGKILVTQLA